MDVERIQNVLNSIIGSNEDSTTKAICRLGYRSLTLTQGAVNPKKEFEVEADDGIITLSIIPEKSLIVGSVQFENSDSESYKRFKDACDRYNQREYNMSRMDLASLIILDEETLHNVVILILSDLRYNDEKAKVLFAGKAKDIMITDDPEGMIDKFKKGFGI